MSLESENFKNLNTPSEYEFSELFINSNIRSAKKLALPECVNK